MGRIFSMMIACVLGINIAWAEAPWKDCTAQESRTSCFVLPKDVSPSDIKNPKFRYPAQSFFMKHSPLSKHAIILLHGVADSPYTMRDIGFTFFDQGYDVYAPLLVSDGTNVEEQINVHASDWKKQVSDLVDSIPPDTKIVLSGFSTGGTLAIDYVENNPKGSSIAGLALFSPTVRIGDGLLRIFAKKISCRIKNQFHWIGDFWSREEVPTEYLKMSVNDVCQTQVLLNKINYKKTVGVPVFTAYTEFDKIVSVPGMETWASLNGPSQSPKNVVLRTPNPKFHRKREVVGGIDLKSDPSISHDIVPIRRDEFDHLSNPNWSQTKQGIIQFIRGLDAAVE